MNPAVQTGSHLPGIFNFNNCAFTSLPISVVVPTRNGENFALLIAQNSKSMFNFRHPWCGAPAYDSEMVIRGIPENLAKMEIPDNLETEPAKDIPENHTYHIVKIQELPHRKGQSYRATNDSDQHIKVLFSHE